MSSPFRKGGPRSRPSHDGLIRTLTQRGAGVTAVRCAFGSRLRVAQGRANGGAVQRLGGRGRGVITQATMPAIQVATCMPSRSAQRPITLPMPLNIATSTMKNPALAMRGLCIQR